MKGTTAAIAYWNQREKSLKSFHGPWTRTGDKYRRDEDGWYVCAGRTDDMLKVGGIWVSPFEVEGALIEHEGVLEAAVCGENDENDLVKPKAFVVPTDPGRASPEFAEELQRFVKERLAPYKYPRWIEFTGELPKTATGKIKRYQLRAWIDSGFLDAARRPVWSTPVGGRAAGEGPAPHPAPRRARVRQHVAGLAGRARAGDRPGGLRLHPLRLRRLEPGRPPVAARLHDPGGAEGPPSRARGARGSARRRSSSGTATAGPSPCSRAGVRGGSACRGGDPGRPCVQ